MTPACQTKPYTAPRVALPFHATEVTGGVNCPVCGEELPERKVLGINAYSILGLILPTLLLPLAALVIIPLINIALGQPVHLGKALILTGGLALVLSLRILARRDLNIHRSHLHDTALRKRREIEQIIAEHDKDKQSDRKDDE